MVRFTCIGLFAMAVATTTISSSEAFVSTSFVRPSHTLPSVYTPGSNLVSPSVSMTTFRSPSTALQMNLFDRFTRVAKSNINNVLKNLEDPEKIMSQALEDMQVGGIKFQIECASAVNKKQINLVYLLHIFTFFFKFT